MNPGLEAGNILGVDVDPFDSAHLLAWSNAAVYESTDGGSHWGRFAGAQIGFLRFDASAPGRIYDISSVATKLSTDGGTTWTTLPPAPSKLPRDLFAIAADGGTLYSGAATGGVWTFTYARRRAAGKH
jgi:photosystem II stability/assembly factor-like uncharacterized protein